MRRLFGYLDSRLSIIASLSLCGFVLLFAAACSELEKPKPEPYFAETAPPTIQEFRWSNGKTPKSFDPARAAAPPETDIVRAVFEGLTDTNPKTLSAIPAVAVKWTASDDKKVWTFELRRDAKWSNGDAVTAEDFVYSWHRLLEMGDEVSHNELLNNIVGFKTESEKKNLVAGDPKNESEIFLKPIDSPKLPLIETSPDAKSPEIVKKNESDPNREKPENVSETNSDKEKSDKKKKVEKKVGVEAIGKYTLRINLVKPDKDFPALVAHPIFRPTHRSNIFEGDELKADIVTNGAFRIASVGNDGVTIDRAEHYWNKETVELERVRFVPQESAEKALESYKNGEVDAVTNANFEPLALKLLEPYDDFRKTVHSALNFYEFNRKRFPFDDRRVREALAISIERERLTKDDLDGASKPALGFIPYAEEREAKIAQNKEKGVDLLKAAGFPNGENFPTIKLYINRNNTQQKIAKSVAKMWKQNLNIETEIIVKESDELEEISASREFDLIRRGVVLPTSDETANMLAIFSPVKNRNAPKKTEVVDEKSGNETNSNTQSIIDLPHSIDLSPANSNIRGHLKVPKTEIYPTVNEEDDEAEIILTEEEAIMELPAIPLYFPTSYSLVKPYVEGFDINTLDAPSLKDVKINNFWQPKQNNG